MRIDRGALALLALGLAGIVLSGYLTAAHYTGPVTCEQGALVDCAEVTTSAYSVVPGTAIPVGLPGLAWAIGVATAGALGLGGRRSRAIDVALFAWAASALLVVLWLVYAEIALIGQICLWCTAFHVVVLAVFLVALRRLNVTSA